VLLINGVCTLIDVIIASSTRVDLILQVVFSHGVIVIIATQAKDNFYRNWFLVDMFFPLAVKVFGCLHQHADEFFHNVTWGMKGIGGLPFLILHAFYRQKVLVVLSHAHATFILKCVVTISEVSFRLGVLLGGLTLFLFDMFFMTRGGSKT
jgi:hypothetical protein